MRSRGEKRHAGQAGRPGRARSTRLREDGRPGRGQPGRSRPGGRGRGGRGRRGGSGARLLRPGVALPEALRRGPPRAHRPAHRRHRDRDGFARGARRPPRLRAHEPSRQGLRPLCGRGALLRAAPAGAGPATGRARARGAASGGRARGEPRLPCPERRPAALPGGRLRRRLPVRPGPPDRPRPAGRGAPQGHEPPRARGHGSERPADRGLPRRAAQPLGAAGRGGRLRLPPELRGHGRIEDEARLEGRPPGPGGRREPQRLAPHGRRPGAVPLVGEGRSEGPGVGLAGPGDGTGGIGHGPHGLGRGRLVGGASRFLGRLPGRRAPRRARGGRHGHADGLARGLDRSRPRPGARGPLPPRLALPQPRARGPRSPTRPGRTTGSGTTTRRSSRTPGTSRRRPCPASPSCTGARTRSSPPSRGATSRPR